jgi:hypothetical protein
MPWWPEDAVLKHEVLGEQGPTLKQIITYVAAVRWLIIPIVSLKHHNKATCDYNVECTQ